MNADFEKAFEKFDECMESFGKGIGKLFDNLTGDAAEGTKINIKKGSTVYIGKGVYAKLSHDVEAIVASEKGTKDPD